MWFIKLMGTWDDTGGMATKKLSGKTSRVETLSKSLVGYVFLR